MICCTAQRLPSGSAKYTNEPNGRSWISLISTPRPLQFFSWIIGLATVAATLLPFVANGTTESKIATGLINLIVGIAIGTLLTGAARSAMRDRRTTTY